MEQLLICNVLEVSIILLFFAIEVGLQIFWFSGTPLLLKYKTCIFWRSNILQAIVALQLGEENRVALFHIYCYLFETPGILQAIEKAMNLIFW